MARERGEKRVEGGGICLIRRRLLVALMTKGVASRRRGRERGLSIGSGRGGDGTGRRSCGTVECSVVSRHREQIGFVLRVRGESSDE